MAKTIKNPEDRKNEILDTAWKLFVSKGYDKTSVSDITNEINVAKGLFHYYFKTKENLLDELAQRFSKRIVDAIQNIKNDKEKNSEQKITSIIDKAFNFFWASESFIMLLSNDKNIILHSKIIKKAINDVVPILASIIEEGVCENKFKADYPFDTAEIILISMGSLYDVLKFEIHDEKLVLEKKVRICYIFEKILGAEIGSLLPKNI